ncbi:MAG: preQ(1) synthase [Candidatus Omnitrophica bacterium]|nr:preQ(1) synthase [Candidatus Omnitrophota bacterium]MDD5080563.1 preQ(1) synthase [Candidatus Omnitrophota bacterium]MDD5441531.1 preQ(1) synthase [Candidatus Omnitrophota bacterium]
MVYEDRLESDIEKKAKKSIGKLVTAVDIDTSILCTIDYEYPKRRIEVEMSTDEFTCVCPFSGLPDFALITIKYVPRKRIIEMKSLKYYLYSFRNVKIYNEHVVNKMMDDLVKVLKPFSMEITGSFTVRGGVKNNVKAVYRAK